MLMDSWGRKQVLCAQKEKAENAGVGGIKEEAKFRDAGNGGESQSSR